MKYKVVKNSPGRGWTVGQVVDVDEEDAEMWVTDGYLEEAGVEGDVGHGGVKEPPVR